MTTDRERLLRLRVDVEALLASRGHITRRAVAGVLESNPLPTDEPAAPGPGVFDDSVFDPSVFH